MLQSILKLKIKEDDFMIVFYSTFKPILYKKASLYSLLSFVFTLLLGLAAYSVAQCCIKNVC